MKSKKDNKKINKFLIPFLVLIAFAMLLIGLKLSRLEYLDITSPPNVQNFGLSQRQSDYILNIEQDLREIDVSKLGKEIEL